MTGRWQAGRLLPLCMALLSGGALAGSQESPAPEESLAGRRYCEHEQARYSPGAIVQAGTRFLRCVEARVQDSKAPPRLVWVELLGPDGDRAAVQMTR